MKQIFAVFLLMFAVASFTSNADANMLYIEDWTSTGYIEGTAFIRNNEGGQNGALEMYTELAPKDFPKWFVFVHPHILIGKDAKDVKKNAWHVTQIDLPFAGYIDDFKAGLGYKIDKNWEARLLYWDRNQGRDLGDFNGIQIRYKW